VKATRAWFALVAALLLPASLLAQGRGVLAGVIVSHETGEPLAYSIVAIPSLSYERFSDESGAFAISALPAGPLVIRVRRLGYSPSDITVHVRPGASDTLRIALSRIAVPLGEVTVRAYPPCLVPGPPRSQADSVFAIVFTQLRLNADQYRLLAESYPFSYALNATLSRKLRNDGGVAVDAREVMMVNSKPLPRRYRPGKLVTRRGRNFYFHIPTLIDFADPNFINQHCFHYAGRERIDDIDLVRLDLVAAERIKEPDVNGSMYFDPTTFLIRRTVLRLSKPLKQVRSVTDMEVTTDFREVMPSIPVIAKVWSVQTMDPKAKLDYDEAYEKQELIGVRFLGAKPGEGKKP
jgi:hypothetical protein